MKRTAGLQEIVEVNFATRQLHAAARCIGPTAGTGACAQRPVA